MLYINRYCVLLTSALAIGIIAMTPSVFADTYIVTMIPGSGPSEFCAETATCFTPSILNIYPGDSITWMNADNVDHTVVSGLPYAKDLGTMFDSGVIASGKSYSFTFRDIGTYKYSDKIDKWMVGEVTVRSAVQSSAVPEFGSFVGIIITISIIGVIMISRRFGYGFM